MKEKLKRINELRDKLNQFDNPSEEFIKAIKKEAENDGIDPFLVVCSDQDLNTIKTKGNLSAF